MTALERLRWFTDMVTTGEIPADLESAFLPHLLPHLEQIRTGLAARAEQLAGAQVTSTEDHGYGRAIARLTTPDGALWTSAVSVEEDAPHRVRTMWTSPYRDLPTTTTITTERMVLRPMQQDDLPHYIEMEADADVMRWVGDGTTKQPDEVRATFEHFWWFPERFGTRAFTIVDRESDAFLGRVFLGPLLEDSEIGYLFVKPAWGRGLATEAARAALNWAFTHAGLKRIVGITYPDNIASQKVLQKCGLVRQGEKEIIGIVFPYFVRSVD
jgi:RimJ/RimL family protein N-acetyltransferase